MRKFKTVNAIPGAGKTYHAIRYAVKAAKLLGENFCFIQPSKKLIAQTEMNIIRAGGQCTVIVSDDNYLEDSYQSVENQINLYLSETRNTTGNILLITQQAFIGLPCFLNSLNWNLICDEIIQVLRHHPFNMEKFVLHLKDLVKVKSPLDIKFKDYYLCETANKALRENMIKLDNKVLNVFRDLAIDLRNPNINLYCSVDAWDKIGTEEKDIMGGKIVHKDISFFGIMNSSVFDNFKSVTIMGANFEHSFMHQLWRDVEFTPSDNIQIPNALKRDLGKRKLDLYYISEIDWSKKLRNKIKPSDIEYGLKKIFGIDELIHAANLDMSKEWIDDILPKVKHISNVSHGLNQYMGIHNAFMYSALNLTPPQIKFLDVYGLKSDEIKRGNMSEIITQCLDRSSVRDNQSTNDLIFCVPDRTTAKTYMEGCHDNGRITIKQIDTTNELLLKKPEIKLEVALSSRERSDLRDKKIKNMQEKNIKLLEERNMNEKSYVVENTEPHDGLYDKPIVRLSSKTNDILYALRKQIMHKKNQRIQTQELIGQQLQMSVLPSIFSTEVIPITFDSYNDFVGQMKSCWDEQVKSKAANILISPAKFVTRKGVTTARGKENIQSIDSIWFDQDNGLLDPFKMREIFPDTHFIAVNSYSSGDRYRYIFPTSTPMTAESYELIWDLLMNRIKKVCFSHGIDRSKRAANSLFYLPCQTKKGESIFKEFQGKDLDPNGLLNEVEIPVEYKVRERYMNPKSDELNNMQMKLKGQVLVDPKIAIINQYRNLPSSEGNGHSAAFFKMFVRLKALGLNKDEISNILNQEAGSSKRKKQAEQIMKTSKYWK